MFEGLVVTGKFNAAAATLYGTQVDGLLRPLPGFDLQGSYGYLHTKYDSFDNPILGNLTGNKFAQAPEHTVHLSATYTHRTSVGEIVPNASYAHISSATFAEDHLTTPCNSPPGYDLVELSPAERRVVTDSASTCRPWRAIAHKKKKNRP